MFCFNQVLTSRIDRGSKNGHEMMRRVLKCVRTQCLRTNAVQSARASRSRPWRFSTVDRVLYVRPWITGTFERTPCIRTQAFFQLPINRPLVILFSVLVFFGGNFFREHFASVSLALPLLFVSFYFKVIFNALF
jgi:ATP/ADP translocase